MPLTKREDPQAKDTRQRPAKTQGSAAPKPNPKKPLITDYASL